MLVFASTIGRCFSNWMATKSVETVEKYLCSSKGEGEEQRYYFTDCIGFRTHNHSVGKQTLNHLPKLAKWLSSVVSDCLYVAFVCVFLSCHLCVLGWVHTLQLSECQGTSCSKQARYMKFKWLQRDSNPQPLSS